VKGACGLLFLLPLLAIGADYEKCAVIVPDAQRLACYDQVAARLATPSPASADTVRKSAGLQPNDVVVADSLLGRSWELDEDSKKGTLRFSNYGVRHD
jgi:hypothetical protein